MADIDPANSDTDIVVSATTVRAPAMALHLDVARTAAAGGRYVPVDAPWASSTTRAAALGPPEGPRVRTYGPPSRWTTDAEGDPLVWRTLPLPSSTRVVTGSFRDPRSLLELAERLAPPPDALAAAMVHCGPGERVVATLRLEGDPADVAAGHRTAWQALELSGSAPATRAASAADWDPTHPSLPDGAQVLRVQVGFEDVAGVVDAVTGSSPDLEGLRLQACLFGPSMWIYLRPSITAQQEAWLAALVREAGGRPGSPIQAEG